MADPLSGKWPFQKYNLHAWQWFPSQGPVVPRPTLVAVLPPHTILESHGPAPSTLVDWTFLLIDIDRMSHVRIPNRVKQSTKKRIFRIEAEAGGINLLEYRPRKGIRP